MPRPYSGPKLWLDPRRGTWTILDGRKRVRTGYTECEHNHALVALNEYSLGNFSPRQRPTGPLPNYLRDDRRGVYVIGYDQYIKIGITKALKARMGTLQTSAPGELKLHALLDGWMKEEKALHQRFAEYRLQGEWFLKKGELSEWIDGGCK